jgi:hypothetical protein
LNQVFSDPETESGDFNLDFKTIPHWFEPVFLSKNWSFIPSKSIKSVLALIVEDPSTGYIEYTDAEIKHKGLYYAVMELKYFFRCSRGVAPKMLIFDFTFPTYENLNKLNNSPSPIKFLYRSRLRSSLVKQVDLIPKSYIEDIRVCGSNRKHKTIKVYFEFCQIKKYQGNLRQLILTHHGHLEPTFMI